MAGDLSRGRRRHRGARHLRETDSVHAAEHDCGLSESSQGFSTSVYRRGVGSMKRTKKQRLERAGWVVADAADLLGLTEEETRFIELKLALASGVRLFR